MVAVPENRSSNSFRALRICLADQVGVHILGSRNLGMAKTLGDTDRVSAGVVKDGCHRMTELMGVDVRKIMAPFKLSEEATQSVR